MIKSNLPQFLPRLREGENLLPWVIGVMLFLTALAVAFSGGLSRGLDGWSEGLATSLTVQITVPDAAERARQTEAALTLLKATPGITQAEIMANSDVLALLTPWLGTLPSDSGLPIPTLITVTLQDRQSVRLDAVQERLLISAPGASLDDHKAWLSQILKLAGLIQILLTGIVVMIALSTIAIVIFGCRAGLATHQKSIAIMHLMGAEDRSIARAFFERYFIHGLIGGFGGVVAALLALWGIAEFARDIGQGLITATLPSGGLLLSLLLLPFATAFLTMFTAHTTVMRALADLP